LFALFYIKKTCVCLGSILTAPTHHFNNQPSAAIGDFHPTNKPPWKQHQLLPLPAKKSMTPQSEHVLPQIFFSHCQDFVVLIRQRLVSATKLQNPWLLVCKVKAVQQLPINFFFFKKSGEGDPYY
jgi:hypothetical protein